MISYRPDYYDEFRCIAGRCKNSCCIGWEIDVDPFSQERYENIEFIKDKIKDGSYVLCEGDRCPFLRQDGLCEQIIRYGEDILCDICREHPRFYNEYDDHTDMGLGLCCEEVCNIVLHKTDKFRLVPEREMSEEIKIIQDRSIPFSDRIRKLGIPVPDMAKLLKDYGDLERLYPEWTDLLREVSGEDLSPSAAEGYMNSNAVSMEQLSCYYLYRYPDKVWFCVITAYLISNMCLYSKSKTMFDIARMYSSEVEYSDLNISQLERIYA
ncbi:MAG: flagellin lysine-N-methylase [Clostridiales bacterium]|nr:flagellin lysine-N-methylase [Clostridiales bacterium]